MEPWASVDAPAGDLNGLTLQHFFPDADLYLAPQTSLASAMFARVPCAVSLCVDSTAINQQIQRAFA